MGGLGSDKKGQNPLRKGLITGCSVVLEMASGGLFMENMKIEKQRTSLPYMRIAKQTLQKGFLGGYNAGLYPWGIMLGMSKGSVLGFARAFFLNGFCKYGMDQRTADTVSGFCAGGVQGIFMSPILLARTRVNQFTTEFQGKISTGELLRRSQRILADGIRQEGVGMLFTGMPLFCVKRSLDWGSRFILFNWYKGRFHEWFNIPTDQALSPLLSVGTAFLGGCTSVLVTMPIDRLMPVLQAAGASGESVGAIWKRKMGEEGFTTLFRGGVMRSIHCGYHTLFSISVANFIYDYLS